MVPWPRMPKRKADGAEVLTTRALGRATLARQMLLAREKTTALRAVEKLFGMQAQLPRPPFIGLWTRVDGFEAQDLAQLVHARKVVRATLMRCTLHLVTAKDYALLRPAMQPALTAAMKGILGDSAQAVDLERLKAAARACLAERPRTFEELRAVLGPQWPEANVRFLGYAVRTHLPLVQVPEDTRWGWPGSARFALAEGWTGRPSPAAVDMKAVVLRYLAAYGPAGARDAQAWSGLRGLEEAFEALRPKLVAFRDEKGRELFDLKGAPRPSADAAAPVRFLPDYDNLLLSHADRSRVIDDAHRKRVATANLRILPTFLVDGRVAGIWKLERTGKRAVLGIAPFAPLSRATKAELTAEGTSLARFVEPDADAVEVKFAA